MGRAVVRAAIATYLQGAGITNLTTVYPYPPKFTSGGEFYPADDPGIGTGAIIYIHLVDQEEMRIALGGPTGGQKLRPYTCGLICVLRSKKPETQEVGADNDAFLDSLVEAIEANRNAGNPGAVFQWGEGTTLYGADVKVRSEMPRPIRQQASQVFSVVEVSVLELVNT